MARSLFFSSLLVASLALLVGCGEDTPSFPDVEPDAGIECTSPASGGGADDAGPPPDAAAMDGSAGGMDAGSAPPPGEEISCPGDQVCLQGRCHDPCADDAECARSEMCSSNGVCVARTRPRPDAGPMIDSGPEDPCEVAECEGDTPVCHPENGACVTCLSLSQCAIGQVCDVASGTCREYSPRPCSPCDMDPQCIDPGTGSSVGTCTMLEGDFERVCVPSCETTDDCPTGLVCDEGRCLPRVGSCTGFVAAVERRPCAADDDCVPFGSVSADGQCQAATTDGGTGVCLQPCGLATDCPAGMTCTAGFCQPM